MFTVRQGAAMMQCRRSRQRFEEDSTLLGVLMRLARTHRQKIRHCLYQTRSEKRSRRKVSRTRVQPVRHRTKPDFECVKGSKLILVQRHSILISIAPYEPLRERPLELHTGLNLISSNYDPPFVFHYNWHNVRRPMLSAYMLRLRLRYMNSLAHHQASM